MRTLVEPSLEQVVRFCAEDPVERVFLEDIARRGLGRFSAVEEDGSLLALCHLGANVVPSGEGCEVFAEVAGEGGAKMIIGDERAVGELWEAARSLLPAPREDRHGQPVYVIDSAPPRGETGLRGARLADLEILVPACRAAHLEELGSDPFERDPASFRWRTQTQIEDHRSWLWSENGTILFKAEAAAWTPNAVQIQQVWVDPDVRNRGYAQRGMRDLIGLLLERVPTVCLFVRPENGSAIRVYEAIGMRRAGAYRSVLF